MQPILLTMKKIVLFLLLTPIICAAQKFDMVVTRVVSTWIPYSIDSTGKVFEIITVINDYSAKPIEKSVWYPVDTLNPESLVSERDILTFTKKDWDSFNPVVYDYDTAKGK